jgi:hypothetical protein
MKKLLFAAMLTVSGAALAQTTTTSDTTVSTQTSASGAVVAPGNNNPEEDARGIRVISDPAIAPAGANQVTAIPPGARVVVNSNQSAVFSTQAATENYPACSATVTDNCVQSYERGRPR